MKIGFWFDYDHTYTFVKIFNKLKEFDDSFECCGFVLNDRYFKYAQQNLTEGTSLVKFYDEVEKAINYSYSMKQLDDFKVIDNKISFSKVAYSDRWLNKYTHTQLLSTFIYFYNYFKNFLEKEKVEVFIFNCVASMYAYLLYLVLKELEIKVIIFTPARIDNRYFLIDNPFEQHVKMYDYFLKLKNGELLLEEELAREAKGIIAHIRALKPAYENVAVKLEKRKFKFPTVNRVISYLYNYLRYYKKDITQPSVYKKAMGLCSYRLNYKRSLRYLKNFNDIEGFDYIYYPLHYEPEIATLIMAPYNQRAIIDLLVKQLPLSYKLVLKEHPAMIGQRGYRFYKEIYRKYPNVVILHPDINSQMLIKNAKVVFSLCGTAILEAIILKKPVIYTGKVLFEGFKLGICSQDLLNFETLLTRALSISYREKDIEYMLASILKFSYDFIFREPLASPEVLEEQNIKKIANAIYRELKE